MSDDLYKRIGCRIREVRKKKGLNQTELAKLIEKSLRTIQKYESGEIGISIDEVHEIAVVLECSPGYLLGYEAESVEELNARYINKIQSRSAKNEEAVYDEEQAGYKKPICDCGGELYLYTEEVHKIYTAINKFGTKAKRHIIENDGDNNVYERLVCMECGNQYYLEEDDKGRLFRGDDFTG